MDLARAKYCVEYIDKHPESLMNCNGVDMAYFIPDDVRGLIAEVERLNEDREWQIKQNERMFTALEQIAKHLKLPCDKRDDGVLEQIVEAATAID